MKSYTITVNGVPYDVTVEEKNGVEAPVRRTAPTMAAPAPAAPVAPAGAKGAKSVTAGAAGKVLKVDVKAGDSVTRGQQVAVLEVMKMETPVVAEADGTIASIDVAKGDSVEVGTVLATMN